VPLLVNPLLAVAALVCAVVLVILGTVAATRRLRRSRRSGRPPAALDDFGLLRTVALVENLDTGQVLRALLTAGGVPATVSTGSDGLVHVLVFPDAYEEARRMVSQAL
jgi:hypothetical protein